MGAKSWWNRTDNRLLEAVLGLSALLVGVFGALLPVLGVVGLIDPIETRDVELEATTRVPGTLKTAAADWGMTFTGTHRAELGFTHPDFGQRLLLALPEIVGSLLLLLVLVLLFRMARTLRDGDVFVPKNARRLSIIGLTVLVQAVLSPVLPALTTALLLRAGGVSDEVPFALTFSGEYVLLALLVLALGEVFRQGTKLRADTEGLV
ncbi:DUF2975 domain-containing protein [Streptomyces sp. NPDC047024]|uniref:DUF2975 domain-containing protein n=1 Tax=Streptomyces sp. NPDC047024 TaxID=3155476 RepID=UPI0033FF85F5